MIYGTEMQQSGIVLDTQQILPFILVISFFIYRTIDGMRTRRSEKHQQKPSPEHPRNFETFNLQRLLVLR